MKEKALIFEQCAICGKGFLEERCPSERRKCCSVRCSGQLARVNEGFVLWSEREDELLKTLMQDDMSDRAMAALLGFSHDTVRFNRVRFFGERPNRRMRWSKEEHRLLADLAPFMNDRELSELTGRSSKSVGWAVKRLGIQRPFEFYREHGQVFHGYPAELQKAIHLHNKLKRKLRDEEHRRPEATPVRAA